MTRFAIVAALAMTALFGPAAAAQVQPPDYNPVVAAEAEKAVKAIEKAKAEEEAAGAGTEPAAFDPNAPENTLNLDLSTGGRVTILLRPDIAPNHVERIRGLTREGFYDGVIFHRVIPGFMAQTGDPSGTGTGGSPLPDLEAEFSKTPHLRGTVSAARTQDPNSANSQFFITFMPNPGLDGEYTALGRVKSGMQFVDAIAVGEPPAEPSHVVRATIGNDVPPMSREELLAFVAPAQRASAAALSAQLPPGIEPDIVLPPPGTPADAAGAATAGEGQTAPAPAIAADSDTPADAPTR